MEFSFKGLIAPVFTPFKKDMSINFDVFDDYAAYLKNNNIDGVLVNGTVGEGMSLNVQERKLSAEKWKEIVTKTKQHLMVQIGGTCLPDVLELARHANNLAVDSILCLPELYYKPQNIYDLIKYLKLISEAAPNTPLLYYHIPSFTNVHLNMKNFLNEVGAQVKTFVGIKFTSTCLDEVVAAMNVCKQYTVFLGADQILTGAAAQGIDSAIATTLNIFPEYSLKILELLKKGNLKEANVWQNKLNSSIEKITKNGSWISTMKTAMNILSDIKVGDVRPPLKSLDSQHVQDMLKDLSYNETN